MSTYKFTKNGQILINENSVLTTEQTSAENLELLEALLKELSTNGTVENLVEVNSRIDVLESELKSPLKISSFTVSPSIIEVGKTADVTIEGTVSGVASAVSISYGNNVYDSVSTDAFNINVGGVNPPTTITVTATNTFGSVSSSKTISTGYFTYYAFLDSVPTSISDLTKSTLLSTNLKSFKTPSNGTSSHVYYAIHKNLDKNSNKLFKDNDTNFYYDFTLYDDNFNTDYRLYRSNTVGLINTTFIVE